MMMMFELSLQGCGVGDKFGAFCEVVYVVHDG